MSAGKPRRGTDATDSTTASRRSETDKSFVSRSTVPTVYSTRQITKHPERCLSSYVDSLSEFNLQQTADSETSVCTYASTLPYVDDMVELSQGCDARDVDDGTYRSDVQPSTPAEFAELFPSSRRLDISYDDSSSDGNLNLRIDTQVGTSQGDRRKVTLFHLRMHNLQEREFSLRRHCRDSGREVCHSSRKHAQHIAQRRPSLQRYLEKALVSFRAKPDKPLGSREDDLWLCKWDNVHEHEDWQQAPAETCHPKSTPTTSATTLQFSNYAHIEIKRRGAGNSRRYEFEYWGQPYTWKLIENKHGCLREISYHLTRGSGGQVLARILPVRLDVVESREEDGKGSWVPPCCMYISDSKVIDKRRTDVAE